MPKMVYCNFCKRPIKPGEGLMYVRLDGTVERYCSSKCFKSAVKLHRNPRRTKWVIKSAQ
ncbi:50S ribosomal protein L24e [Infirmifilum sp. NZ]|uniref:50S ribosomal protein L24e n=1 Tax=Infirmifilum sp. NZ TaxID=2926850 RepID=UPI00279FB309|nr:50S ribosomal protein L24e [Infirmifilum sp. NZ]UNQ72506.1 50S ribosomal protein L24e [Infirmifilum sp. NZ]